MLPEITNEQLTWKDRGLEIVEVKGEPRKDGLREWKIRVSKDNADLEPHEKALLEKYEDLSLHAWGQVDGDNSQMQNAFTHCGLMLAGGLASSYGVWDAQSSFVTSLSKDLNPVTKEWLSVALDCPGFGGSKLKDGLINENNVSSEEYQALMKVVLKILGGNPKSTVIVGHSSGGEAALAMSSEEYKVYACNPALKDTPRNTFRTIKMLNDVGNMMWGVAPRLVHRAAKGITGYFLGGLSKMKGPLGKIHSYEEYMNWFAFVAKSSELSVVDNYSSRFQTPPTLLMLQGDRLTPIREQVRYIVNSYRKHNPEITRDEILSLILPVPESLSQQCGHNGMYENENITRIVTQDIASHIRSEKTNTSYSHLPSTDPVIAALIDKALAEPIAEEPAKEDKRIAEELRLATMRTLSLFLFEEIGLDYLAPAASIFPAHNKDGSTAYPLLLKREQLETTVKKIISHPYILEKEGVKKEEVDNFVTGKLGDLKEFFKRHYFPDDAEDILLVRGLSKKFAEGLNGETLHVIGRPTPSADMKVKIDEEEVKKFFIDIRDNVLSKLIDAYLDSDYDESKGIEMDYSFLRLLYALGHDLDLCKDISFEETVRLAALISTNDKNSLN